MKLLAIDSSTKASGLCLCTNGKYTKHKLIDYSKEKNVEDRIDKMITALLLQIQEWNPDMVVVEQPKGKPNPDLVRKLSEVIGAVRGYCLLNNITYMEVMPSQWRKWLPGFSQGGKKRDELKDLSIQYVKDNLGFETDNDSADSICQGLAVIEYLNGFNDDELFE